MSRLSDVRPGREFLDPLIRCGTSAARRQASKTAQTLGRSDVAGGEGLSYRPGEIARPGGEEQMPLRQDGSKPQQAALRSSQCLRS